MALAASIPEISPIYSYTAEIDTTPAGSSRTWASLCAGFDNISEALNETIQQYFFLCGGGFAANYVTGMAPEITLTGRRVIGDAAQDYIFDFARKYGLMNARNTHFRLTRSHQDGSVETISANVTLVNLSDISGATTDGSAVSVGIRFNGAPVSGNEWSTSYTVTFNSLGGSSVADQTVTYGGTVTTPTPPTKSNNTFGGWFTDSACIHAYNFDAAVTADLTLFAKWTPAT